MHLYSISELEQFSGIKTHTIRIWEKRYNALKPKRSSGNTRYYDNNQLRRLLNIVSLSDAGYKVSKLGKMMDADIFKLLEKGIKETITTEPYEYFISQMIIAAIGYDEAAFEKFFSNAHLRFGLKNTYIKIIYPLLMRVGLMWGKDSIKVAQEHFVSNIIRQKIYTAIDSLPPVSSSNDSWVLFLPENEYHDIGLLFASYIIRLSGEKVYFLGSNVPFNSLQNAALQIKPVHLFFFFVHNDSINKKQKYLEDLLKNFRNTSIHVSGSNKLIGALKLKKEIDWIQSVQQLEEHLIK